MMKRILLIFCVLCSSLPLFSKSPVKGIPKECTVARPFYSTIKNTEDGVAMLQKQGYGQSQSTFGYWDVFSDRDNNTTYLSDSYSKPYSSIGFKERVRIARIKGDFALVYSIGEEDSWTYPYIPPDVEWKGWLPVAHLVLNECSVISPEGAYVHILLRDKVEFNSRLMLSSKLYRQPVDTEAGDDLPSCTNSMFFKVKQENGYVLVSKQPDITEPEALYGWLKEDDVIVWNSRMAFEPAWDISDRSYFTKENKQYDLIDFSGELVGRVSYDISRDGKGTDGNRYRMHDGEWRLPILNRVIDNGYTCAVSGNSILLNSPSPRVPVVTDGNVSANPASSNINLYFIMDGSRLYEPFFPILAERIQALSSRDNNSGIKVGMTIYHDSRNDSFTMESHPLTTPDDPTLFDFIDQGGQYGFKDNLSEAPLFAAVLESLVKAGFKESDQNFLIVVGGRGDSSDQEISLDELGGGLAHMGVHLFGLQVQNNPTASAYRGFGLFMEDLIRSCVSQRQNAVVLSEKNADSDGTLAQTKYSLRDADVIVPDMFASIKNGIMTESAFTSEVDKLFQRIEGSISSFGSLSSSYPEFFRLTMVNNLDGQHFYFKEVALYSEDEFDSLIEAYLRFNECYSQAIPNREAVISAFIAALPNSFQLVEDKLVAPYNGQSVVDKVSQMGYEQVLSIIAGLRSDRYRYPGKSLREFRSDKSVTNDELRLILSDLSTHYFRLLEIRNTPSIYRTVINGTPYYWVPVEDML